MCQAISRVAVLLILFGGFVSVPQAIAVEVCEFTKGSRISVETTIPKTVVAGTNTTILLAVTNDSDFPVTGLQVELALRDTVRPRVYQDIFSGIQGISLAPGQTNTFAVDWTISPFTPSGEYSLVALINQSGGDTHTYSVSDSFSVVSELTAGISLQEHMLMISGYVHTGATVAETDLRTPTVLQIPVTNNTDQAANGQLAVHVFQGVSPIADYLVHSDTKIVSIASGDVVMTSFTLPPLQPTVHTVQLELRHSGRTETLRLQVQDHSPLPVVSAIGFERYPLRYGDALYACVSGAIQDNTSVIFSIVNDSGSTIQQTTVPITPGGQVVTPVTVRSVPPSFQLLAHVTVEDTVVSGREQSVSCDAVHNQGCAVSAGPRTGALPVAIGFIVVSTIAMSGAWLLITSLRTRRFQRQLASQLMGVVLVGVAITAPVIAMADTIVPPLPEPPTLIEPPLPPPPATTIPLLPALPSIPGLTPTPLPETPVLPPTPPVVIPTPTIPATPATPNSAPLPPAIAHNHTGFIGVSETIGIRAVDPDGDALFYEVDWTMNGVVDQRIPVFGTVSSGIEVFTNRTWATPGTKTFQARAVDIHGAHSSWTSTTILIELPAAASVTLEARTPSTPWSASDLTVQTSDAVLIRWSSSNATVCTSDDFTTSNAPLNLTGVTVPTPAPGTHTDFQITCTGTGVPASDTIRVTTSVLPLPTVTVTSFVNGVGPGGDQMVAPGQTVEIDWQATNATHCTGINLTTGAAPNTAGRVPVTLPAPGAASLPYGVTCSNAAGESVFGTVAIGVHPPVSLTLQARTATTGWHAGVLSITPTDTLYFGWSSINATQCTSGDFVVGTGVTTNKTDVPITPIPSVGDSQSYTLTCTGPGGSASQTMTITTVNNASTLSIPVDPQPNLIATPTVVRHGERSTLQYSVVHADTTCEITGPKLTIPYSFTPSVGNLSGTVSSPEITTRQIYTLTCTLPTGETYSDTTTIDTVGLIEEV